MLQADPNADVRGRMINAGIMIIDKHGRENVSLLFPIFENYLNKKVNLPPRLEILPSSVFVSFFYSLYRLAVIPSSRINVAGTWSILYLLKIFFYLGIG